MDYLSRTYTARVRPFRDADTTVVVRWYYCAPGAKVFPGTHLFGSQVWREVADEPPDGAGELFGPKPFDRGWNPGYVGQCHVGPDDWYSGGVPVAAVTGPPPPLPACCFVQPQSPVGDRGGWRAFGRVFPKDNIGGRAGWRASSVYADAGQLGDRGGWHGVTTDTWPGAWGGRGGWQGVTTDTWPGAWGGRAGWQGVTMLTWPGRWGDVEGWRGVWARTYTGQWGLRGGWSDLVGIFSAYVYATAGQAIPNVTRTALNFDTVGYDPHGMWSAAHPSRLTAPQAGTYLLLATAFVPAAGGAPLWQLLPGRNGVGQYFLFQQPFSNTLITGQEGAWILQMNGGDYAEVLLWQNTGAGITTALASGLGAFMSLTYLGPTV
jgi:hypothetical protein